MDCEENDITYITSVIYIIYSLKFLCIKLNLAWEVPALPLACNYQDDGHCLKIIKQENNYTIKL